MAQHSCAKVSLILFTALSVAGTIALSYLSSQPNLKNPLYQGDTGAISDKYRNPITPADWTFQIWTVIFVAQLTWISYALSTICRKFQGDYMYETPGHLPVALYILYLLSLACTIAWTFVWDREIIEAAFAMLAATCIFATASLGVTFNRINKYADDLILAGKRGDIIATILLVHNGIGSFATWTSLASVLNFGIILKYRVEVEHELTGSICLGIIGGIQLIWIVAHHFIAERKLRYLFTPHIVFVVALAGVNDDNLDLPSRNSVLMLALLILAVVALIVKISMCIYFSIKDPLYLREGEDKETKYVTTIALK